MKRKGPTRPQRRCLRCESRYEARRVHPVLYCPTCVRKAWRTSEAALEGREPVVWNADRTQGTCAWPVWFVSPGFLWPPREDVSAATDALEEGPHQDLCA